MKNTRNIGTFFSSSQVLMERRKKKETRYRTRDGLDIKLLEGSGASQRVIEE